MNRALSGSNAVMECVTSKRCNRCKATKKLHEFYISQAKKDGHQSICKACQKSIERERRRKNPQKSKDRVKAWKKDNPEKVSAFHKRYRQTHPEKLREFQKRYRRKYPEKDRAHAVSHRAIKLGEITPPDVCERCGETNNLEAHHPDYSEPKQVQWLCRKCHVALTRKRIVEQRSTNELVRD
jgi:hypothetical protein